VGVGVRGEEAQEPPGGAAPDTEGGTCGDEVQGRPHDDDAHDPALQEQRGQLAEPEPLEPRPQRRIGVQRQLCLKTDTSEP